MGKINKSMKNILFSVFLLILTFSMYAQQQNQKVWDDDLGKKVLVGLCDREALLHGDFGEIFKKEYNSYHPDQKTANRLKEFIALHPDQYKIVVIFGEWCGDSKREVPRFFKLMDTVMFPESNLEIYAVNRKKQGVTVDLSKYQVEYVPVFIVYESDKEIGRIVEAPEESLEKDLLSIFEKTKTND